MILSKRMKAIADLITKGGIVADVGTDHGYIPIYLVEEGYISRAIALDINAGPLERAQSNIEARLLNDKIECRLSNGLEKISVNEVDTIIIAGMGGALITQILAAGAPILTGIKELVLQPQSDSQMVRHYLHKVGYKITDEKALLDDDKYYVVLKAVPGVSQPYKQEYEYLYGSILLKRKDPILFEHLKKECETYKQLLKRLAPMDYESTNQRTVELQNCLDQVEGALSQYDMQ